MTAEIAILNQSGVALAADSAVTLEISGKDGTARKIYNSSIKLFALSKFQPVGIMVYGLSSLYRLPWEIIIKNYRTKLWKKSFPNLTDYSVDFMNYIKNILPSEEQESFFVNQVYAYFRFVRGQIFKKIKQETEDKERVSLREIKKVRSQVISSSYKRLLNYPDLSGIPEGFEETVVKDRIETINKIIQKVFQDLPLTKFNKSTLIKISGLLFKKEIFPTQTAGIVIAGYGTDDIFPSLINFEIDGVVNNILKYKERGKSVVTYQNGAIIVPIAQNDMMATFMEGVNPDYQETIDSTLKNLLQDYPRSLLEKISEIPEGSREKLLHELVKIGDQIHKELKDQFDNFRYERYILPVISAVNALPKDELAIMAETLINLTSFKRKMSLDAETVGGPIDVAVISKGDGFVWIKRKHYFSAELNHHFFKNYHEETVGKQEET